MPSDLVDLVADNDILKMFISGSSNKSISNLLNVDVKSVEKVLVHIFNHKGWKYDLNFSPYGIYYRTTDKIQFVSVVMELIQDDEDLANRLHAMCRTYRDIENRLNEFWV